MEASTIEVPLVASLETLHTIWQYLTVLIRSIIFKGLSK